MQESLTAEQHPVVIRNLSFARRMAREFYRKRVWIGLERQDFEGAAFLGLCHAARRFDPARAKQFRTFAYFRIKGSMLDLVRSSGIISRGNFRKLCALNDHQELGTELPEGELPFAFAKTAEELIGLLEIIDESIYRGHVNDDRSSVELSYAHQKNPEELTLQRELYGLLEQLISRLPKDQGRILRMRYVDQASFTEISEATGGLSRSAVSRKQSVGLDRVAWHLARLGISSFEG